MADELTDEQVFGSQPVASKELSDAEVLGAKPAPKDLSWSEVATGALKSAPSSAMEFGKALVEPILHPIDTATALKNLGLGVAQKLGIAAPGEEEKVADALATHFKERYGGIENIKRTLAKDPVGFLSDASALFTAGGSLAARAPGVIGRLGEITAAGSRAVDPLAMAASGVRQAGRLGTELIGGIGTHTGADALNIAYNAGRAGGERAEEFSRALQGRISGQEVVEHAEEAVRNMYRERSMQYQTGMASAIEPDRTVLNFNQINRAIDRADQIATYGVRDIDPATARVRQEMNNVIRQWQMLDPAIYHTPMGFDAMKRELNSLAQTYEIGTPARRAANEIVRGVRDTILDQAPAYGPIMRGYEEASDLINNMTRTLSLNPNATVDTTLRKLQSVLRNNVNTSYGYRRELANYLVENGSPYLMEYLAGQMLQPALPRGLGRLAGSLGAHTAAIALGTTAAGASGLVPALALAPFSSPRAMANLYYYSGALERNAHQLAERLHIPPSEVTSRMLRAINVAREENEKNMPKTRATGGSVLDNMAEARADGGRTDDANMPQPELRNREVRTLREALPAVLGKVYKNIPGVGALDPNVERRGMDVGHRLTKALMQSPVGMFVGAHDAGSKAGEYAAKGEWLKALGTLYGGGVAIAAPFAIGRAFGPGNRDANIAKTLEALTASEVAPANLAIQPGIRKASDVSYAYLPRATGGGVLDNMAEARANGGSVNWTANNSLWQQLSPYQKAAAMALMEADRKDPEAAKNALGAMINRAARSNQDLGSHVSQRIYQPTIEATQQARLPSILKSEQFKDLAGWAERRAQGQEPDPVQGATHFLAPERTMLALEAQDPNKYKSWRSWTGFDPEAQAYRNVVLRDKSHAFLAPEGRYSAPYHGEGGEGYRQPTSQDQAALDRLVADASQRGAMDDLVQKTTQQPLSIPEADKANLAKMIQGLQKQPEMAPLPPIQPVQLGSPTPIAPVTPYDQPRAMGGGVLRKFKKKADGGSVSSDGVYGDEAFKWPEQTKPQSGWDRDTILPFARKVEDGQVVKGGGILGSDWHFATPQAAYDALNTALHVGTSSVLAPFKRDPETHEKMIEMAGSVVGPQAGVGMARAAVSRAPAGSVELGMFAGRRAAENLAEQGIHGPKRVLDQLPIWEAQGLSPDEIWALGSKELKGTPYAGPMRGVDGQPKFEISDSGSAIRNSLMHALESKDPSVLEDPNASIAFGAPVTTLGSAIHHPNLMSAYPNMENLRFKGSLEKTVPKDIPGHEGPVWEPATPNQPVYGRYTPDVHGHGAGMSVGAPDPQGLRRGILHEAQHDIQEREKFGTGSNPSEGGDLISPGEITPESFRAYQRSSGEVEARTVENRMNLTPEERRARPAWRDYDIPKEQQIVTMENSGPQFMSPTMGRLGSHGGKLPTPKAGPSLDPLGYYSQALEAAKALPQAKGTPEQMLAMLRKGGAKDAELTAASLDAILSGKPSVTRDEVVRHLEGNRVGLRQTEYGAPMPTEVKAKEREWRDIATRAADGTATPAELERMNPLWDAVEDWRGQYSVPKWNRYSLDPTNPSYRETVLHLPVERRMGFDDYLKAYRERFPRSSDRTNENAFVSDAEVRSFYNKGIEVPGVGQTVTQKPDVAFQSGHFSEPNIVGHMMTSMNKHEGKPVFTLDQIQSDWGQKLRDGGVRDEAKIANLRKQIAQAEHDRDLIDGAIRDYVRQHVPNYDNRWMNHMDNLAARDDAVGSGARALQSRWDEAHKRFELANAEKYTAEAATPGHPLVNTTDQWTNTVLRRALTQAIDQGADYIAIPSGETVLSYNPGDAVGMMSFYGQPANRRAAAIMRENGETGRQVEIAEKGVEGIVPKNLRNILKKIDPEAAQPMLVNKLETPTIKNAGQGFTLFPITDKVRKAVTSGGLPLFQTGIGAQPVNPYEDKSVLSRFRKDRQP